MKQKLQIKTLSTFLFALLLLNFNSFAQISKAISAGKPVDGGGGGVIIIPGEGGGGKGVAPGVNTISFSNYTPTTVTVNYIIYPGSNVATLNFAYTVSGVGSTTNQPGSSYQPATNTGIAGSQMLAGLTPNTTYLLTIYVSSAAGSISTTSSFTTLASVLPLTINSLTAKAITNGNQVNWLSASSINVKNIVLERSGADNIFTPLATLPANATQFIDTNPLAGDNYYRLSSTDNDGSTKTYEIIAMVKGLVQETSVYPNPVTNGVLNIVAGNDDIQSVNIINLNGIKVASAQAVKAKNLLINTQSLAKGIYMLQIESLNGTSVKKIVIN